MASQNAHSASRRLVRLLSGPPPECGLASIASNSCGAGYPNTRNGTGSSIYRCGLSNANTKMLPDRLSWSWRRSRLRAMLCMALSFGGASKKHRGVQLIGNVFSNDVKDLSSSTKLDLIFMRDGMQCKHTTNKHPRHSAHPHTGSTLEQWPSAWKPAGGHVAAGRGSRGPGGGGGGGAEEALLPAQAPPGRPGGGAGAGGGGAMLPAGWRAARKAGWQGAGWQGAGWQGAGWQGAGCPAQAPPGGPAGGGPGGGPPGRPCLQRSWCLGGYCGPVQNSFVHAGHRHGLPLLSDLVHPCHFKHKG